MNNNTKKQKSGIVDENIGYSKFKKTKTYILRVDYHVTAKNKEDADRLVDDNSGIEKIAFKEGYGSTHLESVEVDDYSTSEDEFNQFKIEKIAECVPDTYKDDNGEEIQDYEFGEWSPNEFDYKKNEDGSDIV